VARFNFIFSIYCYVSQVSSQPLLYHLNDGSELLLTPVLVLGALGAHVLWLPLWEMWNANPILGFRRLKNYKLAWIFASEISTEESAPKPMRY
jgi:hypothetical protein